MQTACDIMQINQSLLSGNVQHSSDREREKGVKNEAKRKTVDCW